MFAKKSARLAKVAARLRGPLAFAKTARKNVPCQKEDEMSEFSEDIMQAPTSIVQELPRPRKEARFAKVARKVGCVARGFAKRTISSTRKKASTIARMNSTISELSLRKKNSAENSRRVSNRLETVVQEPKRPEMLLLTHLDVQERRLSNGPETLVQEPERVVQEPKRGKMLLLSHLNVEGMSVPSVTQLPTYTSLNPTETLDLAEFTDRYGMTHDAKGRSQQLKIMCFPTRNMDVDDPAKCEWDEGHGTISEAGNVMEFNFVGGEDGEPFQCVDELADQFILAPVMEGNLTVGYTMMFPETHPKLKVVYRSPMASKEAIGPHSLANAGISSGDLAEFTDRYGMTHDAKGRCQKLEIQSFPTRSGLEGQGTISEAGNVLHFNFIGGENGEPFQCMDENATPFVLAPLIDGNQAVGYTMMFPETHPKLKVVYRSAIFTDAIGPNSLSKAGINSSVLAEFTDRYGNMHDFFMIKGRHQQLEILSFPTRSGLEGQGTISEAGNVLHFNFVGGENFEPFQCVDENATQFTLAPMMKNGAPVGFTMMFPEHPKLKAVYRCSLDQCKLNVTNAETSTHQQTVNPVLSLAVKAKHIREHGLTKFRTRQAQWRQQKAGEAGVAAPRVDRIVGRANRMAEKADLVDRHALTKHKRLMEMMRSPGRMQNTLRKIKTANACRMNDDIKSFSSTSEEVCPPGGWKYDDDSSTPSSDSFASLY